MRRWKQVAKLHRWAGAILGAQILLWFGSGFFMALAPIDTVRGDHLVERDSFPPIAPGAIRAAVAAYEGEPTQVTARQVAGRASVEVEGTDGTALFDAAGQPLQALDQAGAERAALGFYVGEGTVERSALLSTAPQEYGGPVPVWRVDMDDRARTRLYLDPLTGDLRRIRTRLWRAFDVAWALHIMDWDERTNFNTWWLRLASGAAFVFALSGVALVVQRMWLGPRRRRRLVAG